MQISIMEISMSLNGNLGLLLGITQPIEKRIFPILKPLVTTQTSDVKPGHGTKALIWGMM